jgi:hypothetical protein
MTPKELVLEAVEKLCKVVKTVCAVTRLASTELRTAINTGKRKGMW